MGLLLNISAIFRPSRLDAWAFPGVEPPAPDARGGRPYRAPHGAQRINPLRQTSRLVLAA